MGSGVNDFKAVEKSPLINSLPAVKSRLVSIKRKRASHPLLDAGPRGGLIFLLSVYLLFYLPTNALARGACCMFCSCAACDGSGAITAVVYVLQYLHLNRALPFSSSPTILLHLLHLISCILQK